MSAIYVYESNLEQGEEKKYYTNLRTKLNTVVNYMEKCIYYLNYTEKNLSDVYSIDEDKVGSVDIEGIKADLSKRINYLKYSAIPEIRKMEKNLELT